MAGGQVWLRRWSDTPGCEGSNPSPPINTIMSKIKNKNLYRKRAFLNPESDGGLAAISASVEVNELEDSIEVAAGLSFSDCSTQIHLDFDTWGSSKTAKFLRERRKKVEHVRTIVNDFLDAVERSYRMVEKKTPAKLAAKKAKK